MQQACVQMLQKACIKPQPCCKCMSIRPLGHMLGANPFPSSFDLDECLRVLCVGFVGIRLGSFSLCVCMFFFFFCASQKTPHDG